MESVKCLGHNPNEQEIWEMQAKVKKYVIKKIKMFFVFFFSFQIDIDHGTWVTFDEFSQLIENHERDHETDLMMSWRALGLSRHILIVPTQY